MGLRTALGLCRRLGEVCHPILYARLPDPTFIFAIQLSTWLSPSKAFSQPSFLAPSPRVPIAVESHSLRCVSSATRSNLSSWNKTSPRSGREMVQGWCTGDTPTLPSLPHCVLALRTDPPSVLKSPYSSSELVDTNLDLLPAPCLAPRASRLHSTGLLSCL